MLYNKTNSSNYIKAYLLYTHYALKNCITIKNVMYGIVLIIRN